MVSMDALGVILGLLCGIIFFGGISIAILNRIDATESHGWRLVVRRILQLAMLAVVLWVLWFCAVWLAFSYGYNSPPAKP